MTKVLTDAERGQVEALARDFGLQLSATLQDRFPEGWEEAMGHVLGAATQHAMTQGEPLETRLQRAVFIEAFNQRTVDCELCDLAVPLLHEGGTA